MKSKKLIYTVGVSCSGKTTWVNDFLSQGNNKNSWVNINRDDIRGFLFTGGTIDWGKYKFTKGNENLVTEMQHHLIKNATEKGKNIIISDTNLNPKYIDYFKTWDCLKRYTFNEKVFHIDLLEALERDAKRLSGVGYKVITSQYKNYADGFLKKNWHDSNKKGVPSAVILDIDGTLASMHNRSPFEWDKVGEDLPRTEIIHMAKGLIAEGYVPIFMSGRDSVCMEATQLWIEKYFTELGGHFHLYMRPKGDCRKDTIIKKELFNKYVNHNYNVKLVLDDRPTVSRMFKYDLGLNVVNVGNPWLEF